MHFAADKAQRSRRSPSGNIMERRPGLTGKDLAEIVQLLEDFAQNLATSLESIGLRNELRERAEFARAAHAFSLKVNVVEPSETYRAILRQSAEMLGAERGSLLLLDHSSNELTVKAAVGMRENVAKVARIKMGEGISGSVLRDGRALMVRNADSFGYEINDLLL